MSSQYEKRKAKEKKTVETPEASEETTTEAPTLDLKAFDVVFDEQQKAYVKVTVAYDLASGTAKVTSVDKIADNQPVAIKKMQEIFTRKVLKLPY